MADPTALARALVREWNATEQPIQQRGLPMEGASDQGLLGLFSPQRLLSALAPTATYEDGSRHAAWPSLLYDGAQGASDLWEQSKFLSENPEQASDPELRNAMAGNSFLAAGLAATGGVGASAAGGAERNALMSNGVGTTRPNISKIRPPHPDDVAPNRRMAAQVSGRLGLTPAIRFQGKVSRGANHALAADEAGIPAELLGSPDIEDGFATSSGRFLSRRQAEKHLGIEGDRFGSGLTSNILSRKEGLYSNPKESALAPGIINAMDNAENALASNAVRMGEGKPIRGYHGTGQVFDKANTDDFWIATNPDFAGQYATKGPNPNVIPVDADLQNIVKLGDLDLSMQVPLWWEFWKKAKSPTAIEAARKAGADAVDWTWALGERTGQIYQVVKPNTVRSATTGEQLFSNPATAPFGLLGQDQPTDDELLNNILAQYGGR